MASGKTHAAIAKVTAHLSAVTLLYPESPTKAAISFGMLMGILITPDLDHHKKTYEETRLLKFNKKVGQLWMWYTKPYAKIFKHRGMSHWLIVGTLTRVIWLLPLLLPLYFYLRLALPSEFGDLTIYVISGWAFQDAIHIITDIVSSWWKRIKKKPLRRRRKRKR